MVAVMLAASGGIWWWTRQHTDARSAGILLHTVQRGDFELTVTERGEVESYDVTEIRSAVKSNNTAGISILKIVSEGTAVQPGDFLVQLDSSALESQRTAQLILVNTVKALEVESHNNYDTAVIANREYLEGTYLQERQLIEGEAFVAEENLNRAKEYFTYSQKLASKGYVNENQLEADRFAVEKAKKDLQTASTKLHVLDEFTKPKQVATLSSAILIAEAKWESAKNSHELELQKLREVELQIAHCTLTAPRAGIVKYAHETDHGGDQQFIVEEGAIIREGQTIIRLPNANSMQVELTINESLIQYVLPDMPAIISPVGFGDRVLHGRVRRVNQYAEPGGWRRANVKEYKAFVSIVDPTPDLRPGLTASVTIECDRVRGAFQVPVQSVYAHGDKFYSFVHDASGWSAREIKTGPTNDKFFVVESGLAEGEQVALNPRQYLSEVDLPDLPPEEAQRTVPQGPVATSEASPSEAAGDAATPSTPAVPAAATAAATSPQSDPSVGKPQTESKPAATRTAE
jgi:multidrug resistance efflux pump